MNKNRKGDFMETSADKYRKHTEGLFIYGAAGVGLMIHIPDAGNECRYKLCGLSKKQSHKILKNNYTGVSEGIYKNY